MIFICYHRTMIIVIGLGNIGQKYQHHRHNVGFQILDEVAAKNDVVFTADKAFRAAIAMYSVEGGQQVLLAKPDTFMNESGQCARLLQKRYPEATIVVIQDDIDITLGEVKCAISRGAGGHNGIQSIIDHLGTTAFFRIRFGVRPTHESLLARILPPNGFEQFLLADFAPFEQELYSQGVQKSLTILAVIAENSQEPFDSQAVMNRFN